MIGSGKGKIAAVLAAILVALGAGARDSREAAVEFVNTIFHEDPHPDPHPFPDPHPVPDPHPLPPHPREPSHAYTAVTKQIFCNQIERIVDTGSPGLESPEEIVEGVTHEVIEELVSVDVFLVEETADELVTAGEIGNAGGFNAERAYLRVCVLNR